MKNKFLGFSVLLVVILLQTSNVYAHISTTDPYGYQLPESSKSYCVRANREFEEGDERAITCNIYSETNLQAVKSGDRSLCNNIRNKYDAQFNSGSDWQNLAAGEPSNSYGESYESSITNSIDRCYFSVDNYNNSFVAPNSFIKLFDSSIFWIASFFGLIYLFFILKFKNIRGWKIWILPLVFQIAISFVAILFAFAFAISGGVIDGSPVPPFYDFLFFKPSFYSTILILGFLTFLVSYVSIFLLLLSFKRDVILRERGVIALFYTFVFNPFFFPVGLIIGFMHLLYAKKTFNQKLET